MSVLTDNALFLMPGPQFLLLYAAVALATLLILNLMLGVGSEDRHPPPPLSPRPDPYEIAYLREGPAGVVGVAIYALKRTGLIDMDEKGKLTPAAGADAPSHPIEATVLRQIGAGVDAPSAVSSLAFRNAVAERCVALQQRLGAMDLLNTHAIRERAMGIALILGGGLLALALIKITVAFEHGHNNIGFLVMETVAALIALAVNVALVVGPVANARGRAYLRRVQLSLNASPAASAEGASGFASAAALALVGAYGFQILANGPDAAFARQMRQRSGSDSGGGSCSSGGGSGCGGGGGGCGGCGGGD